MVNQKHHTPTLYSPWPNNHTGQVRKVSFELEYVGISIEESCHILQNLFAGNIDVLNDNEHHVSNTRLGTFIVELDAHLLKEMAEKSKNNVANEKFDWEGYVQKAISSALKNVIPLEIKTPPMPVEQLGVLDLIIPELSKVGAKDTHTSSIAAFGLHINTDVPSLASDKIIAFLQAYVLLSDWLRMKIDIDLTRMLSTYINEYPANYQKLILNQEYQPTLNTLIDDYLSYNPTRNRALDMLPLFAFIDKDRVFSKVTPTLIKPRPTFHYRLANSNINDPNWNFTTEWNRWVYIEKLAANHALRMNMINHHQSLVTENILFPRAEWIKYTAAYLKQL